MVLGQRDPAFEATAKERPFGGYVLLAQLEFICGLVWCQTGRKLAQLGLDVAHRSLIDLRHVHVGVKKSR
jgi:hypothetical protein